MDLWDNGMGGNLEYERISSLRSFYKFDSKNDMNFGVSWTTARPSRYQNADQGRVFYYYTHEHHKFDKNWDLRLGIINSNAERASTAIAGTKTKQPGRWLQLQLHPQLQGHGHEHPQLQLQLQLQLHPQPARTVWLELQASQTVESNVALLYAL